MIEVEGIILTSQDYGDTSKIINVITKEYGIIGAFTGGVTAAAGGIAAAVFFGYLAALISKPKMKKQ